MRCEEDVDCVAVEGAEGNGRGVIMGRGVMMWLR